MNRIRKRLKRCVGGDRRRSSRHHIDGVDRANSLGKSSSITWSGDSKMPHRRNAI
ncbi:hypothetical protein OH492_14940 [Vibrio chagasii]|nr:hypothetical protein [Vibrio chagasii]